MCVLGHQKQVGPELFRVFYTIWKETEAEAQEVRLNVKRNRMFLKILKVQKYTCFHRKIVKIVKTRIGKW